MSAKHVVGFESVFTGGDECGEFKGYRLTAQDESKACRARQFKKAKSLSAHKYQHGHIETDSANAVRDPVRLLASQNSARFKATWQQGRREAARLWEHIGSVDPGCSCRPASAVSIGAKTAAAIDAVATKIVRCGASTETWDAVGSARATTQGVELGSMSEKRPIPPAHISITASSGMNSRMQTRSCTPQADDAQRLSSKVVSAGRMSGRPVSLADTGSVALNIADPMVNDRFKRFATESDKLASVFERLHGVLDRLTPALADNFKTFLGRPTRPFRMRQSAVADTNTWVDAPKEFVHSPNLACSLIDAGKTYPSVKVGSEAVGSGRLLPASKSEYTLLSAAPYHATAGRGRASISSETVAGAMGIGAQLSESGGFRAAEQIEATSRARDIVDRQYQPYQGTFNWPAGIAAERTAIQPTAALAFEGFTWRAQRQRAPDAAETEQGAMGAALMPPRALNMQRYGGIQADTADLGQTTQPAGITTNIDKVEIVVQSNQDPNRIARAVLDEIQNLKRHPRTSSYAPNYA